MSTLTEFLQFHQASLGSAYTPLMTLYMLAMISPVWSLYLLVCSFLSLFPVGRFQWLSDVCLSARLTLDAIYNPLMCAAYWYLIPYYLKNSTFITTFFFTNRSGELSIRPTTYFALAIVIYPLWYTLNRIAYKKIKPGIDFSVEYLMSFYSPSRIFGGAAVLVALFDFDPTVAHLLWMNIYIGIFVACCGYFMTLLHAYRTSHFLLTNH
ncbi:MAG: hypothetical protein CMF43_05340 [Legionellales bacterium]|nr:hypothetical protein [Legionellales bacterium]|tara:strand:- start:775 stop:1401 length:627 start_codon:yes stop_codon:yes gene_type:complete